MRGTRSGTRREGTYRRDPGIIPKSHFLIGGYTSTDENLRGERAKSRRRAARTIYIIWSAFVAMLRGELASLASAGALRCRRALPSAGGRESATSGGASLGYPAGSVMVSEHASSVRDHVRASLTANSSGYIDIITSASSAMRSEDETSHM